MGALVPKITQKSSFVKPSYTTHIHSPECALCLAVGARRRQEVVDLRQRKAAEAKLAEELHEAALRGVGAQYFHEVDGA